MLSHNENGGDKIILVENEEVIFHEPTITNCFNDCFTHITDSLNIVEWPLPLSNLVNDEPVLKAIDRYKDHPSIEMINKHYPSKATNYSFKQVLPEDVHKQILKLKTSKDARGEIPMKIIKMTARININVLTDCIDANISNSFPSELKLADIMPAFKDIDSTSKINYRPISVL